MHTISHRIARFLERQGILERDIEQSYLTLYDGPLSAVYSQSVQCREGPLMIGNRSKIKSIKKFSLIKFVLQTNLIYLGTFESK